MAAALRSSGAATSFGDFFSPPLQHATSLGHIDVSTQANIHHTISAACYESEDETMGRRRVRVTPPHLNSRTAPSAQTTPCRRGSAHIPLAPAYSRGDIREQYCLSDKTLPELEPRPKKDRLFGCLSGRSDPPSFLGVCVGRRAPSDENLNVDYAPIQRYPRFAHPGPPPGDVYQYDDDLENSYFRRRPTSFCSGAEPKRYSWVAADEESVRLEGPRPIRPDYDNLRRSSMSSHCLSQSSEQLPGGGAYRCPAHPVVLPPPPPPPIMQDATVPHRAKHVSFARSHTLTSFDDAAGMTGSIPRTACLSRMSTTKSQERLIGGKKPVPLTEIVLVEKFKRGNMKTQATQTDVCLGRKPLPPHHLSLSPRTIYRVKMVSQGAQTNGGLPVNGNGRRLMKSLSEAGGGRFISLGSASTIRTTPSSEQIYNETHPVIDHEPVHRTQSEEPPRSPFSITPPPLRSPPNTPPPFFSPHQPVHQLQPSDPLPPRKLSLTGRDSKTPPSAIITQPKSLISQALACQEHSLSCDSETDSTKTEQKEIFIDFEPRISPVTPEIRRKRLQKTLSEGEILLRKSELFPDSSLVTSTSEEDFKTTAEPVRNEYTYFRHTPIKDEGIFTEGLTSTTTTLPCIQVKESETSLKPQESIDEDFHENLVYYREMFRKRSVSLEDPTTESVTEIPSAKSAPPSPCPGDSVVPSSPFASSDSLANDLTRDTSDGIWNESQSTVLQASPSDASLAAPAILTPSARRKHLLLQHQQRSSVDTDALDEELLLDHQQVPPSSPRIHTSPSTQSLPSLPSLVMPSIAVTSSPNLDINDDRSVPISSPSDRRARALSPSRRRDLRRRSPKGTKSAEKSPVHSNKESLEFTPAISVPDLLLARTDSGKTNTDISESTTTDDYVTATDTSRRQAPQTQGSQTGNQDGSSFESASSIYSLARVDAICEDITLPEETTSTTPTPRAPSPARSDTSSSSGSYSLTGSHGGSKKSASSKVSLSPLPKRPMKKVESVSDDEHSAHYSSSGYCDIPYNKEFKARSRRAREWTEDERRRKKGGFNLEISERLISPDMQLSPEENRSPFKSSDISSAVSPRTERDKGGKRIRSKGRRTARIRSNSGEDYLPRRKSSTQIKSPVEDTVPLIPTAEITSTCRLSPQCYASRSPAGSPRKHRSPRSPEASRLKAVSAESLRSVSPGSDSVFYSETGELIDHQVHCHHCGKEVEIITASSATAENPNPADERPDIVQPPAGFADSPDGIRSLHHAGTGRLYKKLEKRFRSEERTHGEKKHHRIRQDARAKSEERSKDENVRQKLRAAGSSPSVLPRPDDDGRQGSGSNSHFGDGSLDEDGDQGIYKGGYRRGAWICIGDTTLWRRMEHAIDDHKPQEVERRSSTESEKDFRKKFQAITHRLVHRRSCVEMYKRQGVGDFQSDKTVIVRRESGEFGFRIHGSKPVVVSAIEPDTPAESSGLEVGDIVLSVNGVSVLDKSHSEVVKIAHAGSDTLQLEVARTSSALSPNGTDAGAGPALYSGYLWRLGGQPTPSGVEGAQVNGSPGKWVRRWFCLKQNHCLYYYKTDADTQPVGAVLLSQHNVTRNETDRPFSFKVTGSGEGPTLQLAADGEEAAARWVAVMSHAAEQSDPWIESSTRNLRLPATAVPRPDCFGYLMKLGSKWRAWTKRYCVLKDACLYFYHDGNSKNAFGMACLQGYRVQPSSAGGKKHAFEVAPPETKQRHYYFHTETEMDKKRWVAALEYSIDRWMKAS